MIDIISIFPILFFVSGLMIGSFLNATEYRIAKNIPLGLNIFTGGERSACVHCMHILRPYDLVPVISFIILRGKCRDCKEPISFQYPIVELLTAGLFVLIYSHFGPQIESVYYAIISSFLLLLFLLDLKYYIVPDSVSLPAILIAGIISLLVGMEMFDIALGAIIGAGVYIIQYAISKGKWVGAGDIRLGALLGALLGWQLTLVALLIAYVGGSIIAIGLLMSKKAQFGSQLPMGVFLLPATLITLLWGQEMLDWYLQLMV